MPRRDPLASGSPYEKRVPGLWAGVDVGDRSKGFHAAVVEQDCVFDLKRFSSPIELAGWLRQLQPELTAIDSPCAPAPFGQSSRPDERELARAGICNIRWTPDEDALKANAGYYGWILHGFELYAALQSAGLTAVECFPTASWTRWGGRRGKRRRAEWSQATLASLGVELPARRLSQDDRDAIGAALTARAHTDGLTESYGQIVVPAPPGVPVLVLTGPVGAGKTTQLPGVAPELDGRVATQVGLERAGRAVGAARVEILEREAEAAQVLLARRGDDVDPVGDLVAAEDYASERPDDHVAHATLVEGLQDRDRVEGVGPGHQATARALSIACSRSCGD